jgi:hypothetical protein
MVLATHRLEPLRCPNSGQRWGEVSQERPADVLMNSHQSYTLASRPQTRRVLRVWAVLSRGTFSGAIFLTDVALIVAMSCITGIAYYLVAYGNPGNIASFVQVGVLAASIFAISNLFRREYRLPNFFSFKPHARRTIQLWNVTLIGLLDARLPGADQRRIFARLDRALLRHHARRADRAALRHRPRHRAARAAGAAFRAAHLPDRHRRKRRRLRQPL